MTTHNIDLSNEPSFIQDNKKKTLRARFFSIETARNLYNLFSTSLGGIFFIPAFYASLILWIVLAQNFKTACFAMAGLILSITIAHILSLQSVKRNLAIVSANGMLSALAVAWLTSKANQSIEVELVILFLTVTAVSIMAAATIRVFQKTPLPPLSLAYCFFVGLLFTLLPEWAREAAIELPPFAPIDGLRNLVMNFLQSLGSVVYSPTPLVGLVIVITIMIWSPTILLAGLTGWCAGVTTAFAMQHIGIDYLHMISAHNYFFAGILSATILFLPGRWNLLIAATAGALAAILTACVQIIFAGSAFAFLPLPSILTSWLTIGALSFAVDKRLLHRNEDPAHPPEEAWYRAKYWEYRAGFPDPYIGVPVSGEVEIVQGFDGKYTHKGPWRHALDFQRSSLAMDTTELQNSTWGTPVYAPMAGIIEIACDRTLDNQPGLANYAENWGNYLVIRLDKGGYLLLAHFRQGTIAVARGSRIIEGDYLGEVGNSGRSPYPHLHMQVQNDPEPGAPTIPFRLANYVTRQSGEIDKFEWHASGVPGENTTLSSARRNPSVFSILSSVSPGKATWDKQIKGEIPPRFNNHLSKIETINLALDQSGQLVFKNNYEEYFVVSIDYDAWRLIENKSKSGTLLSLLALNSMSIPHAASDGMKWQEPALLIPEKPFGWLELLTAPYGDNDYVTAKSKCITTPNSLQSSLIIETVFDRARCDLPLKVTGHYDLLRGPTALTAEFEKGEFTHTLQSFEPSYSVHKYN